MQDTRIFSPTSVSFWLYISKSYRGVRCLICITVQDDAAPVHAKLTHELSLRRLQSTFCTAQLELGGDPVEEFFDSRPPNGLEVFDNGSCLGRHAIFGQ